MQLTTLLVLAALAARAAVALDNGLARTPPMGWNSTFNALSTLHPPAAPATTTLTTLKPNPTRAPLP